MNSLQGFQGYIINNSLFLPAETQVAWDDPRVGHCFKGQAPPNLSSENPASLMLNASTQRHSRRSQFPKKEAPTRAQDLPERAVDTARPCPTFCRTEEPHE